MQTTRLSVAILLLAAGLAGAAEPGGQLATPKITEIESLAQLRQKESIATLEDWQVRVGLADAGDFAGPWRLLCLHLRYTGDADDAQDLSQQPRRHLYNRVGPLTWRIKPAGGKIPESLIHESLAKVRKLSGQPRPVEYLYVQPVYVWQKGEYDLELFGPRGKELLAATRLRVAQDRHDHWVSLAEMDDPRTGTLRIRSSLERRVPKFSTPWVPSWVLRKGRKVPHRMAASLPGRLGPESVWPASCYGGRLPKGKGPHYPIELEITDQALKIRSLAPLRQKPDCFLVRWWVDGVPVATPIRDQAEDRVKELEKHMEREGGQVLTLPWRIPDYIPGLRAGKTLSLQVLYCPLGAEDLPRPEGGLQRAMPLQKIWSVRLPVMISDAESVKVTDEMLRRRRDRKD